MNTQEINNSKQKIMSHFRKWYKKFYSIECKFGYEVSDISNYIVMKHPKFKKPTNWDDLSQIKYIVKFLDNKGCYRNKPKPLLNPKTRSTRSKTRLIDSKSFYKSWEWKKLRYAVLKQYGAICMCCGADKNSGKICVDHIKPRSRFPKLELEKSNLQVLCESCNMGKSNTDYTDWRPKL